ncbi:MAG: class I SAM-dependent methyltransferase [Vicinamibacterales bacterium]
MSSTLSEQRTFWTTVGDEFPMLDGAASTRLYAANEQWLFREFLSPLDGRLALKTDLWDEARNTRILTWAARQGVRAFGIDVSLPTIQLAQRDAGPGVLRVTRADVRAIPFADDTFDIVYSMGTIEHFDETQQAVDEIARVLKPGGRAIVGVPNRHDPFLRPLLVAGLSAVGLYGYGFEKSYSRASLRRMLHAAGLEIVHETGILFIPGWLRMLDLACHAWCPPLAAITEVCVRPFVWLDRHVPAVRRHGYLLATVVTKPSAGSAGVSSPSPR